MNKVFLCCLFVLVSCASQKEVQDTLESSPQYNVSQPVIQPVITEEKVVSSEDVKGKIVFPPVQEEPLISSEGAVVLKSKDLRQLSQWYNQSEEKRSLEWGACFYGYSVEEKQEYTKYFPELMFEAKSRFASNKAVILNCEKQVGDKFLVGDAHIHHNNNILPSFLDTTTWAGLHRQGLYVYQDFHCVFLDNMSIGCYNWKGYPLDVKVS